MTVLLTCSGGGHLKQLHALVPRLGLQDEDRLWVTFDTGLSRSLLADEQVQWATYAAPRDTANILRNARMATRTLREHRVTRAFSTGSSLAVSFLPLAAARGASCHFIETAARASGPSMTGTIMRRVPRVHTYSQHQGWSSGAWRYGGSVLDGFATVPGEQPEQIRTAVVTLGTTESYGFRRLVEHLAPVLDGVDVLWQTGMTDVSGLGIDARSDVPYRELQDAVRTADAVISHAGTGAALTALELGRMPVLVPRRLAHGEHVDDHQIQIADELAGRGLAVRCDPEDLSLDVLRAAAGRQVVPVDAPPPFLLAA